jgi:hypothetical protein
MPSLVDHASIRKAPIAPYVWLLVLVSCLAEVQGFSAWRAAGNAYAAVLAILSLPMAIVFWLLIP